LEAGEEEPKKNEAEIIAENLKWANKINLELSKSIIDLQNSLAVADTIGFSEKVEEIEEELVRQRMAVKIAEDMISSGELLLPQDLVVKRKALEELISPKEALPLPEAKELFGDRLLGPEAIATTFGHKLESITVPPIPFTKAELERAKDLNMDLVLLPDTDPEGKPLTMARMEELLQSKLKAEGRGKVFFSSWIKEEPFFTTDTPRAGWHLITREVIPGSLDKNYLEQTEELANYLKTKLYPEGVPEPYASAITQYEEQRELIIKKYPEIKTDMPGWQELSQDLANLKLNQLTREHPVETLAHLLMSLQTTNTRLLENTNTWTNYRIPAGSFAGGLVLLGDFGTGGLRADEDRPGYLVGWLGVRFLASTPSSLLALIG